MCIYEIKLQEMQILFTYSPQSYFLLQFIHLMPTWPHSVLIIVLCNLVSLVVIQTRWEKKHVYRGFRPNLQFSHTQGWPFLLVSFLLSLKVVLKHFPEGPRCWQRASAHLPLTCEAGCDGHRILGYQYSCPSPISHWFSRCHCYFVLILFRVHWASLICR